MIRMMLSRTDYTKETLTETSSNGGKLRGKFRELNTLFMIRLVRGIWHQN